MKIRIFNNRNRMITTIVSLLVAVLLLGVVGTFAFFRSEASVANYLYSKDYQADLIDIFDNNRFALPGDTLNKDVSMKNNGEVNSVVRIRLTPSWEPALDANGNVLDTGLVTILYGPSYATDWTLIDGWYYYNKILEPGEETSLLVDSLKLAAFSNDHHAVNYSEAVYTLAIEGASLQALTVSTEEVWQMTYTMDNQGYLDWSVWGEIEALEAETEEIEEPEADGEGVIEEEELEVLLEEETEEII
jgi:hypothetical protein